MLLITHYTRILRYIKPDFVHVFVDGRIAEEGGPELAERLEAEGYDKYVKAGGLTMTSTPPELPGLLPDLELIRKPTSRSSSARWPTGSPLVYLDSANTSQKPQVVIDAMVDHLERHNANVARAMHQLGAESTEAFEGGARQGRGVHQRAVARRGDLHQERLRGAQPGREHAGLGRGPLQVGPGDEVVITEMEHHSNIVPWQLLTERTGATLRWFGLTDDGRLDLSNIDELITERTKVVSLTWVSNMLGTINPVAEIARRAHEVGALVVRRRLAGGAADAGRRARRRAPTSLAFTGHKVRRPDRHRRAVGPARACSTQLPPFLGGGEMIETVTMERSTYAGIPHKFEAGTPPIVEAVGLGAAVDYLGRARHGRRPRARAGDHGVRAGGPGDRARADRARARSTPTQRGGAISLRDRRASTRTTSARCSTAAASPSAPGTTAPSRRTRGSACRARPGCRRTSTRRRPRSTRSSRALEYTTKLLQGGLSDMDLDALYQEIILDHYKNPHHAGLREPFEAEVHHVNPTCGDEVTLRVHRRPTGVRRGRVVRRRGLLDQPGRRRRC